MAAQPNQFSKNDVRLYDTATDRVVLKDGRTFPLDTLSGGEMRSVCAALFRSNNTADASLPSRLAAVRAYDYNLLTPETADRTAEPMELTTDQPMTLQDYVADQPTAQPADKVAAAAAALAELFPQAPALDAAEVERLVDRIMAERIAADIDGMRSDINGAIDLLPQAIDEAIKQLRPVIIRTPQMPDVTIEGHAHAKLDEVVRLIAAGNIPYLIGPAGTGKTTLAKQVGQALGLPAYSTALGPTDGAHLLKGYNDANGSYVRTDYRQAIECGGVFLLDEVDGGNPGILKGAFNEGAAAEVGDLISFPDGMVPKHPDCKLIVAANTFGLGANRQYVGASQLDASTLDRFDYVTVDYDHDLEMAIAAGIAGPKGEAFARKIHAVRANQQSHDLRVIVSTRAIIKGARRLVAGFTEHDAFQGAIALAHDSNTVAKLTEGVTFAA